MHRRHAPALAVATAAVLAALLPAVWATDCLFYTTRQTCERYTDAGSCRWDPKTGTCLAGLKRLPPGAFGVAVVGLNPDTAPLVLKPGPSSSSGNVSLGGAPPPVAKAAEVALAGAAGEGNGAAEDDTPAPELAGAFCALSADPGRCRAAIWRWRWDGGAGRCVEFVWGGCGGNANRFESREECETAALALCV